MDESSILANFDRFVESGVVLFDDQQQVIEYVDGKLKLRFLLTNALARKPTIRNPGNTKAEREGSDISTTGFEMGDVGTSHVLVANKFALARPHIMVLTTNGYRRQYEPLDQNDLTAAWTVLNSLSKNEAGGRDYVVFFNCGRDGGCSRLHKHMQLVPTPAESLASFLDSNSESRRDTREPVVPFHWFYHRFASLKDTTPTELAKIYADLLEQAAAVVEGGTEHDDTSLPGAAACPHNLVFTRRWMLVIPRRRGAVKEGLASNAIGMLGVIPVASREEMQGWIKFGPAHALSQLGVPTV